MFIVPHVLRAGRPGVQGNESASGEREKAKQRSPNKNGQNKMLDALQSAGL
jgi:hypothetical protein